MNVNVPPAVGEVTDQYGTVGLPPSQTTEMPMYTTAQNSFVQMPPSASTSPAVPHGMSDNFPSGNVRFQTPYSMMSGGTSGLMDSNFNVGSAMMTGVPLGYVPRAVPASHLEPNTALREEEDDAEENTAAQRAGMLYSDMKQLGVSGEHQAMMECQDQQPFLAAEDEVDYGATPPELQEHFKNCGAINRITIMVDRYTGHPKGYAYIEFQEESAIPNAVTLTQSIFRDRPLKVTPKRKNIPGYSSTSLARGGRGHPSFGLPPSRGGGFSRGYPYGARGRGGPARGFPGYFPRYRGRGQRSHAPY